MDLFWTALAVLVGFLMLVGFAACLFWGIATLLLRLIDPPPGPRCSCGQKRLPDKRAMEADLGMLHAVDLCQPPREYLPGGLDRGEGR